MDEDSLSILVSQSGETKDILNVLNLVQKENLGHTLGVVNVIGSTLMFKADSYIPMACGYEVSVPATKTYFAQTIIFAYLASLRTIAALPFLKTGLQVPVFQQIEHNTKDLIVNKKLGE